MECNVLVKLSLPLFGSFIFNKFIPNGYVLTTQSSHGLNLEYGLWRVSLGLHPLFPLHLLTENWLCLQEKEGLLANL